MSGKKSTEQLYLKLKQMRDDVAEGRVLPTVDEALQYARLVGDTLPYIRSQA